MRAAFNQKPLSKAGYGLNEAAGAEAGADRLRLATTGYLLFT